MTPRAAIHCLWTCIALLPLCVAAAAHADALFVVRKSAAAVDVVEPGSGAILMTVPVGQSPHEIGVSPDGRRAIVTNYGTAADPGNTLSVLDLEQPREIRRIDLGRHTRPHGVHWYAANRAAVTTEGSATLLLIDPDAGSVVDQISTGQDVSHMVAVSTDGSRAFVANIGSGTTTVLDLTTRSKVGDVATGAGSEAIAITPDGGEVWIAAREAGSITILDTKSLAPKARIALSGVPIRLAFTPDGRTLLASCAGSGEVVAIDAATHEIRARRRLDMPLSAAAETRSAASSGAGSAVPVGLAVIDDATIFVAATMADALVQLRLPVLDVVRTLAVSGEPDGLGHTSLLPKFECHACEKPQ
jgi:DNA-binding beta-propeller fold protein YncE